MPRFAPVTSATEPAALLGRGIATSATSGHPTRHYNYGSDKARWRAGRPKRQSQVAGRKAEATKPGGGQEGRSDKARWRAGRPKRQSQVAGGNHGSVVGMRL